MPLAVSPCTTMDTASAPSGTKMASAPLAACATLRIGLRQKAQEIDALPLADNGRIRPALTFPSPIWLPGGRRGPRPARHSGQHAPAAAPQAVEARRAH